MFARILAPLLLALALSGIASGKELLVLASERSSATVEFSEQLSRSLSGQAWHITTVSPDELARNPHLLRADLWISIGPEATRAAMTRGHAAPLIATLLSRGTFDRLLAENASDAGRTTALVIDQPFERQLQFIRLLLPEKRRPGVLVGPETRARTPRLALLAGDVGMALEIEDVGDEYATLPAASRLLARADVFVALPEARIFAPQELRALLHASYRFQRPMIGYSQAFVDAGALAALYATPTQVANQIAEMVRGRTRPAAPIVFSSQFTVAYNRQTARALGIDLPGEASVLRAMRKDKQP